MATNLFVAATRQHVGKSTTSLGLLAALLRRAPRASVAYMKPVGQQHVTGDGAQIDKDCLLAKEFFGLECPYSDMSPVLMPRGYTKRFIDGKVDPKQQEAAVLRAWERLHAAYPNVVVEGTGHMGVGSIVGLDNARVASLLGRDVALVCEGGLGSAFDELAMNIALCREQNVRVRGVIVNKVRPEKAELLRDYFGRALAPLGIPLAGLVPHHPFLSRPSMMDIAKLFKAEFISGESNKLRHCEDVQLITADVQRFKERLASGEYQHKLLVCHGSRDDVVGGIINHHYYMRQEGIFDDHGFHGGIVFTGSNREWRPSGTFLEKLREFDVPTLHAPMQTTHAVELIQKHTHKLNATDRARTGAAVRHVQDHVNLALLGYPAAKPGSGAGENGRLQDANGNGRPQITDFL